MFPKRRPTQRAPSARGTLRVFELNPDGNSFLTASDDGMACLRNLKDGTEVFCATSSTSMNDAIFAIDGASIVTGTNPVLSGY